MATSVAFDIYAKDHASKTFDHVGNSAHAMGGKVAAAAKMGAVAIAAVGAAAAVFAYKVGSDYVTSLNKIQALTGANDKTMNAAAKTLEANSGLYAKMGQTTGDAASGVVELTKAGLSLHGALKAVNSTMVLAKAGEMSVADASTLVANSLNTFHLKAAGAAKIANELANAANISSADVSDLAESFKYVAPLAAKAGLSVGEVSGILAELSNSGVKASQAGTSLRGVLLALQAPTASGSKVLDDLGVQVYTAGGKMRDFGDVIGDLQKSLGKLSDQGRNNALKALFGKNAITGASILIQGGTKALGQYAQGIDKAGAAAALANAKSKGLAGTFAMLKAQLTSTAQSLYRQYSPAINDALLKLIAFSATLREKVLPPAKQFETWFSNKAYPAIQKFSQKLENNLQPALKALGKAIKDDTPAFRKFGSQVSAATPPMVSLAAKITLFLAKIQGQGEGKVIRFGGLLTKLGLVQSGYTIAGLGKASSAVLAFGGAFGRVASGVTGNTRRILAAVDALPSRIRSAVGDLSGLLYNAGAEVVDGLINGITSRVGALTSKLHSITSMIPLHKGPIEKDRKLLSPAGVAIMEGLIAGIESRRVPLAAVLDKVTSSVQAAGSKLKSVLGSRNSFAGGFQAFSSSAFGADFGQDADGNDIAPTTASILAYQRAQASQAKTVKTDVRRLVKMGLSPALMKQLQSAGASGIAEIQALSTASPAQIRQYNALNKQTSSDLQSAGMSAANSIYGDQIGEARKHYADEKRLLREIRDLLHGQKDLTFTIHGNDLIAIQKKVARTTGRKP